MRLTKTFGAASALVLSALVGGTLINATLATEEGAAGSEPGGEYCDVFMDALASELGTDRDGLVAAGTAAALATVDAALEGGDLTDEAAEAIRERIADHDGSGCRWFGPGFKAGVAHGVGRGFLAGDVFEAAASALGVESSELLGQLRDAGSLSAVADEVGADYEAVKAAVLEAIQADLDASVAEGMAQERADEALERVTTWLDEGGELGRMGGHHRPGPWSDRDDAAAADPAA